MPGVVEAGASPDWSGLGFTVAHQKVELEIDFANKSLKGKTEITIHPQQKDFRVIRLSFRQGEIKRITVGGKTTPFKHTNSYDTLQLYGPHYHQRLSSRIDTLVKSPPEAELFVTVPKSVKIDELDPSSIEAQDQMALRATGAGDDAEGLTSSKAADTSLPRFTAVTVNIEFVIDTIREGLQFVGMENGDRRYPHVYTTNSLGYGVGCPLFPCVDDPLSRCTWELSIKTPCSLGDVFDRKSRDPSAAGPSSRNKSSSGHGRYISPDDEGLDMSVVCSGDMTDEIIDPKDSSKKTVSFACITQLSAQQVGFAVGPFEYVNLSDFRESDQDEQLGLNAIPLHGFCLPGRGDELRNTCFPMAKAIDFFSLNYGSYPFSSYKMCFVDDTPEETLPTACLSICSNHLLFPEDIIDTMYDSTRTLVHALSCQWIGVNIVPQTHADTWVTVGVAWYITDTFMRKLCGNNEYRFRMKQMSDRVCDLDYERPSIHDMGNYLKLDASEIQFIALKAPLVLFILDRRLMKASGKATMPRIISRLFLTSRTGDMSNGAITTASFQKTCEKLGHARLDAFFTQWVYGAGCPRFQATQRFNKKKLVVEMMIKQVQSEQPSTRDLEKNSFMRDVKEEIRGVYAGAVQPVFTGSMTIRIHEADGTPYEHIVEIKEGVTKFDIPYNTKYKRLKRNKRQKERAALVSGDPNAEAQEDVLLYCLGDVLQSEEEMQEWKLADWSKEDEERMGQESYEWIRMDADFEWICKLSLVMPGYMYLSQLQQDRDVVAQLESLQYMAAQREHPLISTIFVRTLMDRRYFHGIRAAAVRALVKHAKEEINWLGLFHLERAFQELFCLPNSPMTRSNDFSDRAAYALQLIIPEAISKVRDNGGKTPMRVKRFLHDKLKFNDNSNNEYSDNFYVAMLMQSLCHAMLGKVESAPVEDFDMEGMIEVRQEEELEKDALAEIDRYRRMDEWSSSFQNVYSRAAIRCQMQLMQANIVDMDIMQFLPYTRAGTYDLLRLDAFECLVEMDVFKSPELLKWFIFTMSNDSSAWLRRRLHSLFGKALAPVAFGRESDNQAPASGDGLIIEQESSTEVRQATLARKQTVTGAMEALKLEVSGDQVLKEALWAACNSPCIGILELSEFADLCRIIYNPVTSVKVSLKYPRYWKVKHLGKGRMHFFRSNRVRTTLGPSKDSTAAPTKRKREEQGMPPPGPRITFKQSKVVPKTSSQPPTPAPQSTPKLHIPKLPSPAPQASPRNPATPSTPSTPGGGFKLKLKFGQKPK
ncbi:TATA binding protein associated factor [Aspergillus steynii IBT 23096]|uniref:Transcription initiation factor TFIID subunit 2 n=1 Tax=Aspergillus steynii IBT 23096 TaxID=1392250 RepID=A0A2I2GCR5_9EURO|nr:TATA binding protein associated factor [Aspergillus steynii IBT 23096]PLB50679.1 TATA binding protein associated factor [Aspergillus steynii IBT 23096]